MRPRLTMIQFSIRLKWPVQPALPCCPFGVGEEWLLIELFLSDISYFRVAFFVVKFVVKSEKSHPDACILGLFRC